MLRSATTLNNHTEEAYKLLRKCH